MHSLMLRRFVPALAPLSQGLAMFKHAHCSEICGGISSKSFPSLRKVLAALPDLLDISLSYAHGGASAQIAGAQTWLTCISALMSLMLPCTKRNSVALIPLVPF